MGPLTIRRGWPGPAELVPGHLADCRMKVSQLRISFVWHLNKWLLILGLMCFLVPLNRYIDNNEDRDVIFIRGDLQSCSKHRTKENQGDTHWWVPPYLPIHWYQSATSKSSDTNVEPINRCVHYYYYYWIIIIIIIIIVVIIVMIIILFYLFYLSCVLLIAS